jgi:hypothetical protein
MSPGTTAGVSVAVPAGSGIAIHEAKVWWSVPHQISGADTFALAAGSGGIVGESTTPLNKGTSPDDFVLPSSTTSFTLADYCSNDSYGQGCTFGSGENNILQLFGSQLTLSDGTLPSGETTGGALTGSGTLSGTQSLTYSATDSSSGVRTVDLLVDGKPVASNDYLSQCPYDNFLACPASASGTISWNTATANAGVHEVELSVVSAAGDTKVVGAHAVTTDNPPAQVEAPYISDTTRNSGEPQVGDVLRINPGQWSPQASSFSYQWQICESDGAGCNNIPGATGQTYTVVAADAGHMVVGIVTAVAPAGSAQRQAGSAVIAAPGGGSTGGSGGSGSGSGGGSSGGSGGSGAPGGSGGSIIVNVPGSGLNLGSTVLGSTASWRVSLKVSPRRVRRGSHIKLSGAVSTSPRPGNGKLVYLQARSVGVRLIRRGHSRRRVRVYGKWVTFQAFRANSNGSFTSSYTFRLGGKHLYQFQAVAPAEGQYRNPTGTSRAVSITEV